MGEKFQDMLQKSSVLLIKFWSSQFENGGSKKLQKSEPEFLTES